MPNSIHGIEELQRAMLRTALFTKRDAKNTVTFAAIKFAESARSRSPGGGQGRNTKKKREVIDNPNRAGITNLDPKGDLDFGAKFWIVVLKQGGKPPTFIPTNTKKDPRRKIKNVKLLSQSWMWMLGRLGEAKGKHRTKLRPFRAAVTVSDKRRQLEPEVTFINELVYAAKVAPGIVDEAASAASRALARELNRFDKGIRTAWHR